MITEKLQTAVTASCPVRLTAEEAAKVLDLINLSSAETASRLQHDLAQTRSLQARLHLRVQKQEAILAESKRYNQGFSDGHRIGRGETVDQAKKIRTLERRVAILRERVRVLRDIIKDRLNQ